MKPPLYLSADLGGTSLRLALFREDTDGPQRRWQRRSETLRRPQDFLQEFKHLLEVEIPASLQPDERIVSASLGLPGLINPEAGKILESPHFPEWRDLSLRGIFATPYPIFLENDANQAALGEACHGAARDWPNFLLLTLGTGIGGGVVVDGELYRGPQGFAGEFGHLTLDRGSWPGPLGIRGSWESLCSQSGLQARLDAGRKADPHFLREILDVAQAELPERLAMLAKEGHPDAREIWRDFGRALACGIASLGHAFGIFRFVIGGGLAQAWELFFPSCLEELPHRTYASLAARFEIIPAALGNEAGLWGGFANARRRLRENPELKRANS